MLVTGRAPWRHRKLSQEGIAMPGGKVNSFKKSLFSPYATTRGARKLNPAARGSGLGWPCSEPGGHQQPKGK